MGFMQLMEVLLCSSMQFLQLVELQGIRLMHLCDYHYADVVLTLAYASVYFRSSSACMVSVGTPPGISGSPFWYSRNKGLCY